MIFTATQTTSSISTFLLCMVLFPDVQKRIQAELDTVVGRKRLPTFEDRAALPYLDATIKESLRFHPPTPLGIAHLLVEDDVVQGGDPPPLFSLFRISTLTMHHKKSPHRHASRSSHPEGLHRPAEHLGDEHEREAVRPSGAIRPRAVPGPYARARVARVRLWPPRVPRRALFHR